MRRRDSRTVHSGASTVEISPRVPLQDLPVAALVFGPSGRVVHSNVRASLLLERACPVLQGMSVVELLGRDLLWTSMDESTPPLPLTLLLPSGRRLNVMASMSTLAESVECTRTLVVLTSAAHGGPPSVELAPRIATWAEVADRLASLDSDALCVAIGVVGLQSVNDGFSRSTGDAVIAEIGRRLVSISPIGAIVERISGDHFVLAFPSEGDGAVRLAEIVRAVHLPIVTRLGAAAVGCAVGVTTGPSRPPLVLLDRADRNLTVALARGTGTIEWSDLTRPPALRTSARLGAPLVAGVANRAISAHFQPVVQLATGTVVEYEALARWQDGVDRHLAAQFIPVAEDTGLVREVGIQVMGCALELIARLSLELQPANVPRVSVNVSASEIADTAFADKVSSALAAAAVPAGLLQLELTDSIGPQQADYARLNIRRLRSAGVRFALDSFGRQSANLMSLRDFAVDVVKLDPVLVLEALHDARSMNLLRSILGLAEQIGIDVIAKGIETIHQHDLLLQVGCHYGQGFFYAPPLPPEELAIGNVFPVIGALAGGYDHHRRTTSHHVHS